MSISRAVVTDPFGFSDITGLTINVAPLGTTLTATSVNTAGCVRGRTSSCGRPRRPPHLYTLTATAKEGLENTVTAVRTSIQHMLANGGFPVFALGSTSTRCQEQAL